MSEYGDEKERVGYGRPPKQSQFKKGQSGNPGGRPKKRTSTELDLGSLLGPVTVKVGGQSREMQTKEVELRRLLDKAIKGQDLGAIDNLLKEFANHGAIEPPKRGRTHGVIRLPNDIPYDVAMKAFGKHGPPPWKARMLAPIKAAYLATRTEADRIYDDIVGYDL